MDKKILIIRLSSIGDILLATPFIRQARFTFPNARIDFLVKEKFKEVVEHNPHLDKIYSIKDDSGVAEAKKMRQIVKENDYTFIYDLHNNYRSNIITAGSGAELRKINKHVVKRFLLVRFKSKKGRKIPSAAERYLATGRKENIADDFRGPEIYWRDFTEIKIKEDLEKHGFDTAEKFICLAPGAAHPTKQWPLEYFEELIKKSKDFYSGKFVIIGGPQDKETGEKLGKIENVFDFSGKLSLLESAALIRKAIMLISNDSGMMHMATAVKIPVIAIFGSTVKELGFFPYRSEHIVIENTELNCRPCSHIGKDHCPKKHFKCMKEILPEMIVPQIKKFL